jgi:hypothetical protein
LFSTAEHNQVSKKVSSLLTKYLSDKWKLHEETPMDRAGLQLERVSAACVADSGRSLLEHHNNLICVGHWKQDLVLVSNLLKRIGLMAVCRPMEESSDQLAAAHVCKLQTYSPLMEALRAYLEEGWGNICNLIEV